MKIAFVLDDTLDVADGVQQYILLLGKWLTTSGHQVHYLVASSHRDDIPNISSLAKQYRIKFNRNVVPLALPTSPKKIASLLDSEQFDILHVQLPYSPAFGARVVSLAPQSTAVVGTFHIMPYAQKEKWLTAALGYWLKPTIKRFNAVASVSQPARDFALQTLKISSQVIPNAIDLQSYRGLDKRNKSPVPHLVFVGRLVPRKGCQHFIKALALLDQPFRASIVGDGNQKPSLKKLTKDLGLEEKIEFAGFVDEKSKQQILHSADYAVFPATGGESFGIVLLEAMAAGSCIVLAGDNPGYRSVMSAEQSALFEPHQHQALADKLSELITHESKADKLYAKQQQLVKGFDINKVGPQILGLYSSAIAKQAQKRHTKD